MTVVTRCYRCSLILEDVHSKKRWEVSTMNERCVERIESISLQESSERHERVTYASLVFPAPCSATQAQQRSSGQKEQALDDSRNLPGPSTSPQPTPSALAFSSKEFMHILDQVN